MKAVPLIRVGMLLPIVSFLEQLGAPVERHVKRAGIPIAALANHEAFLPLHQAAVFADAASLAEGIPNLGFAAAPFVSVRTLGALGAVLRRSTTLHEVLRNFAALHGSYVSGGRVWLEHEPDRVWLRHTHDLRIQRGRRIAEQLSLVIGVQLLRAALGPTWCPLELQVPGDHAPSPSDLSLAPGAPVKVGAASTGIAVARASLPAPVAASWRVASSVDSLKQAVLDTPAAADFAGSVQQTIGTLLLDGYPTIERTAHAIGSSVRTLQRRLTEGRVTYSRLIEQERTLRAMTLLSDRHVTITEIALALGYSDVANFTHAFQRWTGLAPREFRRLR